MVSFSVDELIGFCTDAKGYIGAGDEDGAKLKNSLVRIKHDSAGPNLSVF
jgi:hypothetical protein